MKMPQYSEIVNDLLKEIRLVNVIALVCSLIGKIIVMARV
jgi:hypothetical protein